MSQQAKIIGIDYVGPAFYLGKISGTHAWTRDGLRVGQSLARAWHSRFNQQRSVRCRYFPVTDDYGDQVQVLRPIGSRPYAWTTTQARAECSWLVSTPSPVLAHAVRMENESWWAAIARRKTLKDQGKNPGRMPGFRSAKHTDLIFGCWRNQNKTGNAIWRPTGRKTGIVTITGQTRDRDSGRNAKWSLKLRIRVREPIRDYTSIQVNLTRMQITFVNTPVRRHWTRGSGSVGLDRGATIAVVASDGSTYHPPTDRLTALQQQFVYHQRKMAKSARVNGHRRSGNYHRHKHAAADIAARMARIRYAWAHQVSTDLIRDYALIFLEALTLESMTRKGSKRKRATNRSMRQNLLGAIETMLAYKATLYRRRVYTVPPAYTSQRCHQCGCTSKKNRESQAEFSCIQCGWTGNADYNAARNIEALGLLLLNTHPATDLADAGGEAMRLTTPPGVHSEFFRVPASTSSTHREPPALVA